MPNRFDLSGKTAVVTGGGRGIGRAVADALAEAGVSRLVVCSRKLAACEEAAQAIATAYGTATEAVLVDLAESESVEAAIETVRATMGPVDVLVNNAGVAWGGDPIDVPEERWEHVFRVNVTGLWRFTMGIGRSMLERRQGSVINVASVAGLVGTPTAVLNALPYSSSKAAVIGMTRDLAVKWAPFGVRVNALAPGFFPTRMTASLLARDDTRARIEAAVPMGRVGDVEELKGAAVFLASDAASYITGQVLAVDGGYTAS